MGSSKGEPQGEERREVRRRSTRVHMCCSGFVTRVERQGDAGTSALRPASRTPSHTRSPLLCLCLSLSLSLSLSHTHTHTLSLSLSLSLSRIHNRARTPAPCETCSPVLSRYNVRRFRQKEKPGKMQYRHTFARARALLARSLSLKEQNKTWQDALPPHVGGHTARHVSRWSVDRELIDNCDVSECPVRDHVRSVASCDPDITRGPDGDCRARV